MHAQSSQEMEALGNLTLSDPPNRRLNNSQGGLEQSSVVSGPTQGNVASAATSASVPEVTVQAQLNVFDGRCRTLNGLIKLVKETLIDNFYKFLQTEHVTLLMDSLMECYQFACSVTGSLRVQDELARVEAQGKFKSMNFSICNFLFIL